MSNPTVNEFCKRHAIRHVDSSKRAHKLTKMNTQFFRYGHDYNIMDAVPVHLETETLHTVEISESELERIAEFEAEVFNHMELHGHYNMFEHVMKQKEEEKYLRKKYPAVQKAFEQYSLMLKLAQSGEI